MINSVKTTYSEFLQMANQTPRVVLCQEIDFDRITPAQAFHQLNQSDHQPTALLEFAPRHEKAYAFVGLQPMAELSATQREVCIRVGDRTEYLTGDPFSHLRTLRQTLRCAGNHPLSQLTGGAVGYLSYDAVRFIESIPDRHNSDANLPDIHLIFYRTGITFDDSNRKAVVSHVVDVDKTDLEMSYHQGMTVIEKIIKQCTKVFVNTNLPRDDAGGVACPANAGDPIARKKEDFETDLTDEQYVNIVNKAKSYIAAGDIFQVVASRTFKKKYSGDPFYVYQALKKISPSPYHFYLQNKTYALAGASPEKIVSVKNKVIESIPLAGTRSRKNDRSDEQTAAELIRDPKEAAEHVMLVDLARSDVGAVSVPGSVTLTEFMRPVTFSHVIHLTSTVQGKLAEHCDAIDAVTATFPAGTLSGAPKIRAMEIIDEIESSRRGLYGGALVALGRDDNLDTCIIIRAAFIENGRVSIRAGGGIVHDSDPYSEAKETRYKAQSVMSAVHLAEGSSL